MYNQCKIWSVVLLLPYFWRQAASSNHFLIKSLFSGVPPVINFTKPDFQVHHSKSQVPEHLKPYLCWAKSSEHSKRFGVFYDTILTATGIPIHINPENCSWFGKFGHHTFSSSRDLKKLNPIVTQPYQKYNHIPKSLELGNKVKMGKHLANAVKKFGRNHFPFVLESYGIPSEMHSLQRAIVERERLDLDNTWIVKPAMASKSKGVFLINSANWKKLESISSDHLVQKYLTTPFLNSDGRTVQLRTLVLLSSVLPLRVFISYEEDVRIGQASFNITEAMHAADHMGTSYCSLVTADSMRLTCNATESESYIYQPYFLTHYFNESVIKKMKVSIENSVIKTLTTVLPHLERAASLLFFNRYNGYQLFSFDYLLDENYKPWLHEINTHSTIYNFTTTAENHFDYFGVVVSSMNIVGYHLPPTLPNMPRELLCEHMGPEPGIACVESIVFNKNLYSFEKEPPNIQLSLVREMNWENLTDDAVKLLMLAEDELQRSQVAGNFKRIFPSQGMEMYLQYIQPDLLNYDYTKLMSSWEQEFGGEHRAVGIRLLKRLAKQRYLFKMDK